VCDAVQRDENERKKPFLNYKSAAPSGGATGAELAETRAWTEATLYFSAPGVGSISSLLACVGLSSLVTFGPICKELIRGRSWPRFVRVAFCSKSSGRLALGAASSAEPESSDVFANAPKFVARVTKTGDK